MAINLDSLKWLLDHAVDAYETEIKNIDKIRERISFIVSLTISPCLGVAVYLSSTLRGEIFSEYNIFLFWMPMLTR